MALLSGLLSTSRPRDAKSCEVWLRQPEVADPRQAVGSFLALLDELQDTPPKPVACLHILERLRPAAGTAHEEQAKRFAGKPLPLGQTESAAFVQSCDLWLALLNAYRSLWKSTLEGSVAELEPFLALLCHRVIACTARLIETHQLARRELKSEYWQWLHEAYAVAEIRGVAEIPVADGSAESHCVAAYAQPLLAQLADPNELPSRELTWLHRWTRRWAHKTRLRDDLPSSGGYVVDLDGQEGAVWKKPGLPARPDARSLRYLDLAAVGQSVVRRLRRLAEGGDLSELSLGRDCTQPEAGALLKTLARSWLATPNKSEHHVETTFDLVSGLAAVCRALGGTGDVQPEQRNDSSDRSYQSAERMHVFQNARQTPIAKKPSPRSNPDIERWESLRSSDGRLRLGRRESGTRVAHRQLIALKPRGSTESFALREIIALTENADRSVTISTVPAFPEQTRSCEIRLIAGAQTQTAFFPALMVSPFAECEFPSLALPAGWYQHGRLLELRHEGKTRKIKLLELLGRGFDYDAVSYLTEA